MSEGTRIVDYGKDIAELAQVVKALQMQVNSLQQRLEDQGTLYGGAVAYTTQINAYSDKQVPKGSKTQFNF